MNTLYQNSNSIIITCSSLNTQEIDDLKEGQWLITHHSLILHQHLVNTPIRLSLSHSNTTVPQDTLSHTDITGNSSVKRVQH